MAKELALDIAMHFFLDNSGWNYADAADEEAARMRENARQLAIAEQHAKDHGWSVEWTDDWEVGDHATFFGRDGYPTGNPTTCESATLYDASGSVLASLGCIDDATADYRRVVAAELALEAMNFPNG